MNQYIRSTIHVLLFACTGGQSARTSMALSKIFEVKGRRSGLRAPAPVSARSVLADCHSGQSSRSATVFT